MNWKFTGNRPVYQQIMEHIRTAVITGEYAPGTRIPAVRELASEACVNPNTMQRALFELERERILVSNGTLGRYVTKDAVILNQLRQQAIDNTVAYCARQFLDLGIPLPQAAELLLKFENQQDN